MKCPICKKELEEGLHSCPYCGVPIHEENNEYVKGTLSDLKLNETPKKGKEKAHDEYIQKGRTQAGFCSLLSFPLMLGALTLMLMVFVKFNDGTPGINIAPYSALCLAPSFALAVYAFFKAKEANFKAVERLSLVVTIIDGILTFAGFIMIVLVASSAI